MYRWELSSDLVGEKKEGRLLGGNSIGGFFFQLPRALTGVVKKHMQIS